MVLQDSDAWTGAALFGCYTSHLALRGLAHLAQLGPGSRFSLSGTSAAWGT